MDQAFFLRAKRLLEGSAAPLSYQELAARVAAQQAQSPTAQAGAEPDGGRDGPADHSLAALLLVEPNWRRAVQIQGGCFSRAAARRRVNRP